MKKTILALTALSLGIVFTACQSEKAQTTEERLSNLYGWKGEALPKPVPNPDETVSVTEKETVTEVADGKDAGIVSTVDVSDTIAAGDAKADGKDSVKAGKSDSKETAAVKVPLPVPVSGCELSGETKTYVVKQGESLWTIAAREYKSGSRWDIIYKANKELLKDRPNTIRPGMKLVIPLLKQKEAGKCGVKAPAVKTEPAKAAVPVSAPAAPAEPASLPPVPAAPAAPAKEPVPAVTAPAKEAAPAPAVK